MTKDSVFDAALDACMAYMNDNGISVAVAAPEAGLQETDVALISDIVMTQASLDLADIRIVEVK